MSQGSRGLHCKACPSITMAWGEGGLGSTLLYIVKQDLVILTESLFALQYSRVVFMELWMPCMEVEKLQMSLGNCMDRTGRSCSTGGCNWI